MTNNDVLRRLRYTFDYGDDKMIALFALADRVVLRAEVSAWLKREEDPDYHSCSDTDLATFLNGMIVDHRGRREGPAPAPETRLTNNLVLRKLKIALELTSDEVLDILWLGGSGGLSQHELSALFRRPDHKHYRQCLDQVLRNFLSGLQQRHRPAPTT